MPEAAAVAEAVGAAEAASRAAGDYDGGIMKTTRTLAKPLTWILIIALIGTVGAGLLQGIA